MRNKEIVSNFESLATRVSYLEHELTGCKRESRHIIRLLAASGIITEKSILSDGHLSIHSRVKMDISTAIEHLDIDSKRILKILQEAGIIHITKMNALLMAAMDRFSVEPTKKFDDEIEAIHRYLGIEWKEVPEHRKLVEKKQPKKPSTKGQLRTTKKSKKKKSIRKRPVLFGEK